MIYVFQRSFWLICPNVFGSSNSESQETSQEAIAVSGHSKMVPGTVTAIAAKLKDMNGHKF